MQTNSNPNDIVMSAFMDLVRSHRSYLYHTMAELGLRVGQPILLFHLRAMGVCSQKDLAKATNRTQANITVTLQRMEKAGLVSRANDRADSRVNWVSLTDKGRALSEQCIQAFSRMHQIVFQGFTVQELNEMAGCFQRMRKNIEEHIEQGGVFEE